MPSIFKYLYDTSSTFLFGQSSIANMDGTAETSEKSWTPAAVYDSSRYSPSVSDVLDVKSYLFKRFDLPIELIDTIIDTAEYWPHTSTITDHSTMIRAQRDRENQFIVSTHFMLRDTLIIISYDHTHLATSQPKPETRTRRCYPNTSPHIQK
jgi:hypothetical protein